MKSGLLINSCARGAFNFTYLKVIGNFFASTTAALKSDTMSLHTMFGLSQSGLPGHQTRCFRDWRKPRGSRINKTIRTFRLVEKEEEELNNFDCIMLSHSQPEKKKKQKKETVHTNRFRLCIELVGISPARIFACFFFFGISNCRYVVKLLA